MVGITRKILVNLSVLIMIDIVTGNAFVDRRRRHLPIFELADHDSIVPGQRECFRIVERHVDEDLIADALHALNDFEPVAVFGKRVTYHPWLEALRPADQLVAVPESL